MKSMKTLQGIIPALITPFKEDGTLNAALLEKQVAYLADAGVDGFFVNGTTGEGPYLNASEKKEAFRIVQSVSAGRQFLCLACIQPSTQMVLEEMRVSAPLSPDFVVAVPPYYYGAPQEVVYQHYQAIAAAAECPLILYDIPSRTQNSLALETAVRLLPHPNIVGMKDSSGDFIRFSRGVLGYNTPSFAWIQGEDYLDGASLLLGARGIVTGLGNVWIEPYIKMRDAHRQGNAQAVLQAQAQINTVYEIINITGKVIPPIKAAAMLLGRSTALMKTPGLTLNADEIAKVKDVLKKVELL